MKKNFTKEYLSIPNLLGYFRIILLPIYLYVYINASSERDYYLAVLIIFLSFLSDFLDGKIARHFNMITDFGKILDPIADKITQGALALSFTFRYPAVAVLLAVFLIKEAVMGILGLYLLKQGVRTEGAKMHGKICTAILDATMFVLLLFHDIPVYFVYFLIIACILAIIISFILYMRQYHRQIKELANKGIH
ncbi:CDP-alcohol phosphatidyltransferase family protein [Ruminococcus sp. OA3]|uniref:CDP-alcohol phosphatidyltransferase family protein n=1 Tax=Ruminococcus sp. OA3 TaxID=2914164 RepID=UPI001F059955|nr:CDP-alcohol phosphatidyltransferase family protein [Ruminococcus sp. OA3]MCH1983257.1 CDP-alcohol phosphatidyltransferase family protein [Ruminococcus sp. OA3]